MEDKRKKLIVQLMKDSRDKKWSDEKIELEFYRTREKINAFLTACINDFVKAFGDLLSKEEYKGK